jgi:hypothetical protein
VDLVQTHPVTVTIDDPDSAYNALQIRSRAGIELVDDIDVKCACLAHRSFGNEHETAWLQMMRSIFDKTARLVIHPEWVGILDDGSSTSSR